MGDTGGSRGVGTLCEGIDATRPRGAHVSGSGVGLDPRLSFDGEGVPIALVGEVMGVVEFRRGEGEAGDSGRRNGEALLGELKERGEGL